MLTREQNMQLPSCNLNHRVYQQVDVLVGLEYIYICFPHVTQP